MPRELDAFLAVVDRVYGARERPKVFHVLRAVQRVRASEDPSALARPARTTPKLLAVLAASSDPIHLALKSDPATTHTPDALKRARGALGQMLLGLIAERTFERIYKTTMGTSELRLEDSREERTDTDYRVYNGRGKSVFRMNIKFHGSAFRQAKDLVGLEPHDCFALATYKIHGAVNKQEAEHLPYIFVIVGVHGLTKEIAGVAVPSDLVELVAMIKTGRRDVEDAVVRHLIDDPQDAATGAKIAEFQAQIDQAGWRVLSARRADKLLREKLFDRIFALRVKSFTQSYRGAEVDMHFSIRDDLTPLTKFLQTLRDEGLQKMMVYVERGTY